MLEDGEVNEDAAPKGLLAILADCAVLSRSQVLIQNSWHYSLRSQSMLYMFVCFHEKLLSYKEGNWCMDTGASTSLILVFAWQAVLGLFSQCCSHFRYVACELFARLSHTADDSFFIYATVLL